jgi:hypothetical protein
VPHRRIGLRVRCLNRSPEGTVKSIDSLYYNCLRSKGGTRYLRLAAVGSQDISVELPDIPPWPICDIPAICQRTGSHWFHSQATLETVQSIDVCKDKTTTNCLGILLHYADRVEALGQWRFDQLTEKMAGDYVLTCIHFRLNRDGVPYVKDISFDANPEADSTEWMTVTLRGRLVWWFSERGGYIFHEDV